MKYYVCDRCNGRGYVGVHMKTEVIEFALNGTRYFQPGLTSEEREICPICKGAGKLNWIENILGKEETTTNFFNKCLTSEEIISFYRNTNGIISGIKA